MQKYDVIVIGAGAAGLFCGIQAGRRGRNVLILDHARLPAQKIRISGGGRCNFTNLDIQPDRFLSNNPKFALSALKRFTQWDFIDLMQSAGIAYHEKTLGQLFCDGSSQQVIDMLLTAVEQANVDLKTGVDIQGIQKDGRYSLQTSVGDFGASSIVVACGGKSIPKMGATGFGYRIAEQFGVGLTDIRPALVPLTFGVQDLPPLQELSGTSVQASVTCNGVTFDEGMLFTHHGLSGPSILQISSYWKEGDTLSVNLTRDTDILTRLIKLRSENGKIGIATALAFFLPKKLANLIQSEVAMQGNLADQNNENIGRLADRIHHWRIKPVGSEGYRKAEVTLGGVDTDFLNSKTMEAKAVPGLFFIGEVVDVTGWLGGYNFQWAWSSGWAAGQVV